MMMHITDAQRQLARFACSVIFAMMIVAAPTVQAQSYKPVVTLLRADETLHNVELLTIDEQTIRVRNVDGTVQSFPRSTCIGFIATNVEPREQDQGIVVLSDGQRFTGRILASEDASGDNVVWDHRWLGVLNLPLRSIDWIAFENEAQRPNLREWDTLILTNNDRVEGFVLSIGSTVSVELEDATTIDLPVDRIRAIRLVNPQQPPADDVARVWINNGSVYDVGRIALDDDGMYRLSAPTGANPQSEFMHHVSHVAGVVFDADSLVPLAGIEPHDIEGPEMRYVVPPPEVAEHRAALDLRTITLRGPLTARYRLPEGAQRMLLRARLEDAGSPWADTDLIVRVDGNEVARTTLTHTTPTTEINVPVDGAEIAIELTEGAHGPVKDIVVLEQAMILRRSGQ